MTFEIGIIGTIIVIVYTVKYFMSKGTWGKRDEERCVRENEKMQKWIEEQREEYSKRGEKCYF